MATLLVTKPVSLNIQHNINHLNHLQQLPSFVPNEPRVVRKKSPVSSDHPLAPSLTNISHGAFRWNSLSDQLSSLSMTSSEKMPVSRWRLLKRASEEQTPLPYRALKDKAGKHPRSPVTVSARLYHQYNRPRSQGLFFSTRVVPTYRSLVCVCQRPTNALSPAPS